jgi:hypothetical protein
VSVEVLALPGRAAARKDDSYGDGGDYGGIGNGGFLIYADKGMFPVPSSARPSLFGSD